MIRKESCKRERVNVRNRFPFSAAASTATISKRNQIDFIKEELHHDL
jgi:hypothetical protein